MALSPIVEISSRCDGGDVTIDWVEQGGPRISGTPERQGFGTRLAELSIAGQLGGSIDREWRSEGLAATIKVNSKRLCR
jgi:two-component sensor histidine kinase